MFLGNVRHPFYRIASLRRLAKNQAHHFLHDLIDKDLETFYEEGRSRNQSYFDNLQTHRFAGEINAEKAIATIKKEFGVVGTTDTLFAASQMLIDDYGWTVPPLPPLDAPPDAERYASLAQQPVFKKICDNNEHDIAVFEFVNSFASGIKITRPTPSAAPKPRKTQNAGPQDFEFQDRAYYAQKKKDPSTSYAAFMMERVAGAVAKGAGHNSLGSNIVRPNGETGRVLGRRGKQSPPAHEVVDLKGTERVCDYGCGSLRIGAHFIKRLPPAHFYGVDVVDTFFEIGKTLVGDEHHGREDAAARRHLARRGEEGRRIPAGRAPTRAAVCLHVHPDEFETYLRQPAIHRQQARSAAVRRHPSRRRAGALRAPQLGAADVDVRDGDAGTGDRAAARRPARSSAMASRSGTAPWNGAGRSRGPACCPDVEARSRAVRKRSVEAAAKRSSRADAPAPVAASPDPEKSYLDPRRSGVRIFAHRGDLVGSEPSGRRRAGHLHRTRARIRRRTSRPTR